MTVVTGFTTAHMQAILNGTVASMAVVGGHLIITKVDGTNVDLGQVQGATGAAGTNGTNGATGPTGPPGTAGVWINGSPNEDNSFVEINPITASYQIVGSIVIPASTITRSVVFYGRIALKALTTQNATYRGSIRDRSDTNSWTSDFCAFNTNTAGLPGKIVMISAPFYLGAGVTKTFDMLVRRETGSGGSTDGDGLLNTFTALVAPSALPSWWAP
jgi:hypothetical protein